jgi:chromosome segregation protein
LSEIQIQAAGLEREVAGAADAERAALRAMDAAEAARDRAATRRAELQAAAQDLTQQFLQAQTEHQAAVARRAALPAPETGEPCCKRPKCATRPPEAITNRPPPCWRRRIRPWPLRVSGCMPKRAKSGTGKIARGRGERLAQMAGGIEEIAQERAVHAARPPAIEAEMHGAELERETLQSALAQAEARWRRPNRPRPRPIANCPWRKKNCYQPVRRGPVRRHDPKMKINAAPNSTACRARDFSARRPC